ncbi:MAG: proteasome subunit beta [Nanoarchaeota archaeon]
MDQEIKGNVIKMGTTLVGITCKDGVIIASDRRASSGGGLVVDKAIRKIRQLNDYMLMSLAGNASDAILLSKVIAAELRLKELRSKSRPSVREAANLIAMSVYRNIRTPAMIPNIVGSICGGFNEDGTFEIYAISPAGDIRLIKDYDATGSGMLFVIGLLERQYKEGLSIKEGIELAKECIKSSTQRDTASGNGIDVFTITKSGITHAVSEEILPQYK